MCVGKIAADSGVIKLELPLRLIRKMSQDHDNQNRQEQVTNLLHTAARRERAPESLRDEVTAMRERAGVPPRRISIFRRPVFGAVSLGMPAIAAAVVALFLALGGAGAPTLAQAAALASRGPSPSAPAPELEPGKPSYLTARVGGLHFPNWKNVGGWRTVGVRRDKIGNRDVMTVYYAAQGKQIAYSIVSSPVLGGLNTAGEPYTTIWHRGRVVVAWEEHNHTCLLSGSGVSAAQLWHLASAAQSA